MARELTLTSTKPFKAYVGESPSTTHKEEGRKGRGTEAGVRWPGRHREGLADPSRAGARWPGFLWDMETGYPGGISRGGGFPRGFDIPPGWGVISPPGDGGISRGRWGHLPWDMGSHIPREMTPYPTGDAPISRGGI